MKAAINRATKSVLVVAGIIACLVGAATMIVPVETEAGLGITIGHDVSLLNEMRSSGGGLMGAGIVIVAGALIAELTYAAALLGTLTYFGYGLARVLSMLIDGIPDPRLLLIVSIEIAVGSWCLSVLLKLQQKLRNAR